MIGKLRNLGKHSQEMLAAAGIKTEGQLQAKGAAAAFVAVKCAGCAPSLNLLWAIEGKPGTDKDWAGAKDGRYLNVVRVERPGAGPAGNATDFPIFSDLSDEQILVAFVTSVSAITGCTLEPTVSKA